MKYRFRPSPSSPGKIRKLLSPSFILKIAATDRGLLMCVFGLVVFGWVMVYSSSALVAETRYHDQYFFLKKQIVWSLLGLIAFVAAANVPVPAWQASTKKFYGLTVLLLVAVLIFGPEIAGAKRWLRFSGFSFQPSELAKLAMVFTVADYLDRRQSRIKQFRKGLVPLLVLLAFLIAPILAEPDLGTPMLMCAVFGAMLIMGGVRWKHVFLMCSVAVPVVAASILTVGYRLERMFAYLDPWSDAQGAGYQLVQSLLALGSGGIFGRGLGNSKIKISNLPDAHTDFVFSVMGEEIGLIGTLMCAALFLFLSLKALDIAHKAPSAFSRLVAAGIGLTIGLQALINMGVACGMFPTKGMPLPFISFGGSSLFIVLASVGILLGISRQSRITTKKGGSS